jgi:hypothetical protein
LWKLLATGISELLNVIKSLETYKRELCAQGEPARPKSDADNPVTSRRKGVNEQTQISISSKEEGKYVRFEVFTAVTMKNGVFWDV